MEKDLDGLEKKNLNSIKRFQIILLCLTAMSGQFSLSRIDPQLEYLGYLGEPRTWMIVLLAFFSLPLIKREKDSYSAIERERNRFVMSWLLLVLNCFIYLAISALWSTQSDYAREIIVSLVILIAIMLFAYLILRSNVEACISYFLRVFAIVSIVYAVGGLVGARYWSTRGQLAFLWGGANAYSRVVASGAIISLYLWVKHRNRAWLIVVPLLSLTALLSGSRGGVYGTAFAFFLALVLLVKDFLKWTLVLAVVVAFIIIFILSPAGTTYGETLSVRFPTSVQGFHEAYEHARAPWFSKSMEVFRESPLIGVGIGGFMAYGIGHSHNMILGFAAEGGILGLLFLLIAFIPVCLAWRRRRTIESNVCFILGISYLAGSMISGSYYDQRFVWLFFLLFLLSTTRKGVECNIENGL